MKGFSFKGLVDLAQEAWSLATASVKKAGDTMTGNLIVDTPNGGILLQGTNLNQTDVTWSRADSTQGHTIRFSEDIEVTNFIARAKDSVALRSYITHDHASGETKLYRPRAADPQGTTPESLTRKDYVDELAGGKVNKAGDTMTGPLVISPSSTGASSLRVVNKPNPAVPSSNAIGIDIYDKTGGTCEMGMGTYYVDGVKVYSYVGGGASPWVGGVKFFADKIEMSYDTRSLVPQGTTPGSFTRKDYVDGVVAKKTDKVVVVDTGVDLNTLQISGFYRLEHDGSNHPNCPDSSGYGNMFISQGSDSCAQIYVNPFTGATYTRSMTNAGGWNAWGTMYSTKFKPTAADVGAVSTAGGTVGDLNIGSGGSGWGFYSDADHLRLKFSTSSSEIMNVANASGSISFNFNVSAPKMLVSAAQGTEANALTRKDYVDAKTWTAAKGNSDIVAGSYGQVGTYGFFARVSGSGAINNPGTTAAGSGLRWTCADGNYLYGTAPAGTWKLVGCADDGGDNTDNISLWIRIA